jgi:phage gp16-like protein
MPAVKNSRNFPAAMRNKLIAKIHVAKKQLGLDDDQYRSIIQGATNGEADSCKDCNEAQLERIMTQMTEWGFKPVVTAPAEGSKPKVKLSPVTRGKPDPTQVDKIRAVWIDLANKGIIRNRSDDAIQSFAKRLTRVDRLEWLTTKQCQTVLAALKAMEQKAAKNDSVTTETP